MLQRSDAQVSERYGSYMHTYSGRKYWPLDPRPSEVSVIVIAHHLAMRCRWGGAVRNFFSVAEHSVYVALLLALWGRPKREVKAALFHDGSESYNGDLIRPLKYSPEFAAPFKAVEKLNDQAVAIAFDVEFPWPEYVHKADEAVCAAEAEQIVIKAEDEDWTTGQLHDHSVVAPFHIACWAPIQARENFLALYDLIEADQIPRTVDQVAAFLRSPVGYRDSLGVQRNACVG